MNKKSLIITILVIAALGSGYFLGVSRQTNKASDKTVLHQTLGYHQSYFSQPEVYDKAFQEAALTPIKPNPDVAGVIVNHHLLVPSFIADTLNLVASDQPTTVLLVSPNHFDAGSANVISSLYDWQTPYGVLPVNQQLVSALADKGTVKVEEQPFGNEHGISAIVPFIKKTMPQATVVPLIFRNRTSAAEVDRVLADIRMVESGRVIMVTSVDFSHYLPSPVADFHDILSEHTLRQFDFDLISRLEIDSQPSIRLLLGYMQARGTENFTVLNHSNSAKVLDNFDIMEGTSYVTGYFTPGNRAPDNHQTFLAAGDVHKSDQLDNTINPKAPNYIFAKTERLFWGSTQTFMDLTYMPGNSSALNQLTKLGANNNGPFIVIPMTVPGDSLATLVSQVKQAGPADIIVSVQWPRLPESERQRIAHSLIDAGSDLVIGHGTANAAPGPVESYNNKLIVYSIGTLVPANLQQSTQSVAVGMDVADEGINYSLFPVQYKNGLVTFIKPSEGGILPASLKQQFYGRK